MNEETDHRIATALDYAIGYGQIDGAHHRLWVIDQMVRALTGCPVTQKTVTHMDGKEYTFDVQGENDTYRKVVTLACKNEDGDVEYEWDTGIAP